MLHFISSLVFPFGKHGGVLVHECPYGIAHTGEHFFAEPCWRLVLYSPFQGYAVDLAFFAFFRVFQQKMIIFQKMKSFCCSKIFFMTKFDGFTTFRTQVGVANMKLRFFEWFC